MIWIGFTIGGVIAVLLAISRAKRDAPQVMCPHCHTRGSVTVEDVQRKQGVSGGKATGALMTGGASMFLTGLSRKQWVKHMHCRNCDMPWDVV